MIALGYVHDSDDFLHGDGLVGEDGERRVFLALEEGDEFVLYGLVGITIIAPLLDIPLLSAHIRNQPAPTWGASKRTCYLFLQGP